jgi:hypothetical protein
VASLGDPAAADWADRLVLRRLAEMEVRGPEQEVTASFTDAADEDPLGGAG